MPNHVFNTIEVEEKYASKLESLIKTDEKTEAGVGGGLFQSVHPMPNELDISSPQNNDELKKIGDSNEAKYGHRDWYSWRTSNENWGTKWGDYDSYYDDCVYQFNTAWSPPSREFLHKFAKIIPDFIITYEEEQGWGGYFEFKDGRIVAQHFADIPEWQETDIDEEVQELKDDYIGVEGDTYKAGFYYGWSLQEYLGATKEEAEEEFKLSHA